MKKLYIIGAYILLHFSTAIFGQYTVNTTLKDINIFPGSDPKGMSQFGDEIIMSLKSPETGTEPFKYNTSNRSFQLIKNLDNNFWDSIERHDFYRAGSKFYYFAGSSALQLWVTDMETAITTKVKNFEGYFSSSDYLKAKVVGDKLFIKIKSELYVTDGTAEGTVLLTTLSNTETDLADLNGEVYFLKNTAETGTELWKSNGTVAGTKIVADLNPGWGSSGYIYEEKIYTVNNKILYYADGLGSNSGIYITDGTANGTSLLKKTYAIFPNKISSDPTDKIVFTTGNDLWISDAVSTHSLNYTLTGITDFLQYQNKIIINSNSGTYVVDQNEVISKVTDSQNVVLQAAGKSNKGKYVILTEVGNSDSQIYILSDSVLTKTNIKYGGDKKFVETDDRLIFNGYTETNIDGYNIQKNTELFYYKYDGTTGLEKEFFTHSSSHPRFFKAHKNKVFFIATVGTFDQLFMIDDTNKVEQVGILTNAQSPYNWTSYDPSLTSGDYIYYKGATVIRSNGTAQGTQQIALAQNERLLEIYPLSDTAVLLKSYNTQHGFMRLWKLNTNSTNPELLLEMPSYSSNLEYSEYSKIGNFIYFKMWNIDNTELWKSDGSAVNTVKVRDVPSSYWTKIFMKNWNGKLFFVETSADFSGDDKLYYLDPTTDVSHFVASQNQYDVENSFIMNDELYFMSSFYNPSANFHLNKINSTMNGTEFIAAFPSNSSGSLKCGNYYYLNIRNSGLGHDDIYRTDGTATGTFAIAPDLYYSTTLGCLQNEMYFKSDYNTYFTNGQQGNRNIANFSGEGDLLVSGNIYTFNTIDDRLFITYNYLNKGYELFVSDIFTSPLATQNIRTNLGDRSIVVYPNPASNDVTIKIPGGDKIVSVEFLDATGRTVANSNKEMINIEKLPTGIYIIKVLTKDKIYSGKVIKK